MIWFPSLMIFVNGAGVAAGAIATARSIESGNALLAAAGAAATVVNVVFAVVWSRTLQSEAA